MKLNAEVFEARRANLKPTLTVVSPGPPRSAEFAVSGPSQPIPEHALVRAAGMETRSGYRVVSYNILADCYNGEARTQFCERGNRVLAEILSVQPHIICLQEVMQSAYDWMKGSLVGYGGCFVRNATGDGVAILLHPSLRAVRWREVHFARLRDNCMAAIRHHSVAIMCEVLDTAHPARAPFFVSTSHLYWSGSTAADFESNYHIQLHQIVRWSQMCAEFAQSSTSASRGNLNRWIVCGDFNHQPESTAYRLLHGADVALHDARHVCALPLRSVWNGQEPAVTCSAGEFSACVDYIYASPGVHIVARLRGGEQSAWPSDHAMVGAELALDD